MVVLFHKQQICCRESYDNNAKIDIMVKWQEYKPGRNNELYCHIQRRHRHVRHVQLVGHQLVCVLAVSLAEVLVQLYAVADGENCVGTVYSQQSEV